MNSARGSNAATALSRSIIALSKPDPDDDAIRVEVVKSNVGMLPYAIGFRITEQGIVNCPAPYSKSAEERASRLEEAKSFLLEALAAGARPQKEIEELAVRASISKKTCGRAKKDLGIRSNKRVNKWWWELPAKKQGQNNTEPKK
jgi:hypothetical protein